MTATNQNAEGSISAVLQARISASAGEPKVMLSHAEAEGLLAALTPEGSPFPLRDKSPPQ